MPGCIHPSIMRGYHIKIGKLRALGFSRNQFLVYNTFLDLPFFYFKNKIYLIFY